MLFSVYVSCYETCCSLFVFVSCYETCLSLFVHVSCIETSQQQTHRWPNYVFFSSFQTAVVLPERTETRTSSRTTREMKSSRDALRHPTHPFHPCRKNSQCRTTTIHPFLTLPQCRTPTRRFRTSPRCRMKSCFPWRGAGECSPVAGGDAQQTDGLSDATSAATRGLPCRHSC